MMSTSDSAGAAAPLKRWRWYELFIVIILVAVAAISWSRRLTGPIDLRYDASTYYNLGTSLAEGKGYRLLNEPGEIEATQYPPLLPIIVAAHQRILGTHDVIVVGHWLRITFFLVYIAFALAVYFAIATTTTSPHQRVTAAPKDDLDRTIFAVPFGTASFAQASLITLC